MTRMEERISDQGIMCTKQPGTDIVFAVVLTAEDGNSRLILKTTLWGVDSYFHDMDGGYGGQ